MRRLDLKSLFFFDRGAKPLLGFALRIPRLSSESSSLATCPCDRSPSPENRVERLRFVPNAAHHHAHTRRRQETARTRDNGAHIRLTGHRCSGSCFPAAATDQRTAVTGEESLWEQSSGLEESACQIPCTARDECKPRQEDRHSVQTKYPRCGLAL